jgi:endonuclease/exonuclease/phosphatase family metal-dependent hydrolase
MKIVSWNLLHRGGANAQEVARLIEREQPDLLLMQEATQALAVLEQAVGGCFARVPQPGRVHGLAMWARHPMRWPPQAFELPAGTLVDRVCQVLDLGPFAVANVHLSHGQVLNRRQLRHIAQRLPPRAAVIGDYNLVGPVLLPGFRDVGPRRFTHRMSDMVPLRLDRCVVRGLICTQSAVLQRGGSDHHPIALTLGVASEIRQQQPHGRIA